MATGYSPRIDAALVLAARAHRNQVRKGSDIPYIIHPAHVAFILQKHGFDEDVVVAGILHDTVEDTDVEEEELRRTFGDGVADLVAQVSEVKLDETGERRSWRARKEDQIAHLEHGDARVAALKAADSLHNMQSTVNDLRTVGPALWSRFNATPADWVWYHGRIASLVRERLGDHPLAKELQAVVDELAALSGV